MSDKTRSALAKSLSILVGYQVALLLISVSVNWFLFGVESTTVSLPTRNELGWLALATILLLVNHAWLMTSTEFARAKFGLFATPEEWEKSGKDADNASEQGTRALARQHSAHRNTTENTVYFCLTSAVLLLASPPAYVSATWLMAFALARLGYTYGYLSAKTGVRGIFMSLSLIALYGAASYGFLSLHL